MSLAFRCLLTTQACQASVNMIILRAILFWCLALQIFAASTSRSRLTHGSSDSSDSDDDWNGLSHQSYRYSDDDDFDEVLSRILREEANDTCDLHNFGFQGLRRRPTFSRTASADRLNPSQSHGGQSSTSLPEPPAHPEGPLDRSPRLALEACKLHAKYMCLFAYDACYNIPVALHHAQAIRQMAYDAAAEEWRRNRRCEGLKTFAVGCAASLGMTAESVWQSCGEAFIAGICGLASGCNAGVIPLLLLPWCKKACDNRAKIHEGQSSHGHQDEQPLLPPWKMSPQDEEKLEEMYAKIEFLRGRWRQQFRNKMDVRKNFENQVRHCFEYFTPPG